MAKDTVEGIRSPYFKEFGLWGAQGKQYVETDDVPKVGMANTYAVKLDAPASTALRYLWVQEGKITALMAHQPITNANIYDTQGNYLGRPGQPPSASIPPATPVTPAMRQALQSGTFEVQNPPKSSDKVGHTFRLRPDLNVEIPLPPDLTKKEARRLAKFIRLLPLSDQDV